jgi:hypothetical protein
LKLARFNDKGPQQRPFSIVAMKSNVLDIAVDRNLRTHCATECDHTLVDDPVINLHTFATATQNFGFEQGVQMLRHIGLRGVDFI